MGPERQVGRARVSLGVRDGPHLPRFAVVPILGEASGATIGRQSLELRYRPEHGVTRAWSNQPSKGHTQDSGRG